MIGPGEPGSPEFRLAEGFTLPPLEPNAMAAVNQALSMEHYTSAPLVNGDTRQRIFGGRNPQGVVGRFACSGFAMHTLAPAEGGVATEAFVAPATGLTEIDFLDLCVRLNMQALPKPIETFQTIGLRTLAAELDRRKLAIATGVHIAVSLEDTSVSFASLSMPRFYMTEFGKAQSAEEPPVFAMKFAALLFSYLTIEHLRQLRAADET